MAIFYVNVKVFSRAQGHTATAAAAYRAGVRIVDDRTGLVHDYRKRDGVESVSMLAPVDAPAWASDLATVWSAAEVAETRSNARVARELLVALPAELDAPQRRELATAIAQSVVDRYGVAVMIAIHGPGKGGDDRNHHAHLLMTTRSIAATGFGPKVRVLDDQKTGPAEVRALRELVAELTNRRLLAAGSQARVDPRSLDAQAREAAERGDVDAVARLVRTPQRHEGKAATAALRRGEPSRARQRNQGVLTDNAVLADGAWRRVIELHQERGAQVRARLARSRRPARSMRPIPSMLPVRPRRLPQETSNPYLAGLADTVAWCRRLMDEAVRNMKRRAQQADRARQRAQQERQRSIREWGSARDDLDATATTHAAVAVPPDPRPVVEPYNPTRAERPDRPPVERSAPAVLQHPIPHESLEPSPASSPAASSAPAEPESRTSTANPSRAFADYSVAPQQGRDFEEPLRETQRGAATTFEAPSPTVRPRSPRNGRAWAELRRQQRAEASGHAHRDAPSARDTEPPATGGGAGDARTETPTRSDAPSDAVPVAAIALPSPTVRRPRPC